MKASPEGSEVFSGICWDVYVCLMWDWGDLAGMCVFGELPTGDQVKEAWREIHGCPNEAEFRVEAEGVLEGCWRAEIYVGDKRDKGCKAEIRRRTLRS